MYLQHPLHPAGYRQIQLTEFVSNIVPPLDAVRVTIQPSGQDIRFRDDSIDPTVTSGMHVAKDTMYVLDSDTKSLRLITEANTNAAEPAVANLASGPANSDLSFESVDTGPEWNGYHFAIVTDAVAGVNSSATLNSAAVNSDITFAALTQDPVWDGYTFTTVLDANAGANANATLNINAANGDLVFTSPTKSATHNGMNFTADSDGAESITYAAGTFTLKFNTTVSNGATMKTAFDTALGLNPSWPQWTCAVEGNGSGAWVTADDDAETVVSANGVTPVAEEILFAGNTFTIHIFPANTAAQVVVLWAGGPANCANFAIADEGAGGGVVQAKTSISAGGTIPVATSIDFAAHTFTIHTIPAVTTANGVVALWAGGPANCADWTITEEGDGTGVVGADTDTSANGADAVGAVVNLLWHKEL